MKEPSGDFLENYSKTSKDNEQLSTSLPSVVASFFRQKGAKLFLSHLEIYLMKPEKIVDSHQHCNWHHRNIKGLVKDLDEHDIQYAWLLSWYTDPQDTVVIGGLGTLNPANIRVDGTQEGITLNDILDAKAAYPERFIVGFCPRPEWVDAPKFLEAAYHMHGARICGEWKYRSLIDDPRSLEIFRMAGSLKMPVVLHLDVPYLVSEEGKRTYQPSWYGGTIENLERALKECPETDFIGHAPGFWREISGDSDTDSRPYPNGPVSENGRLHDLFDRNPNLYADLSAGSGLTALRRDSQHAVTFLNRFSDRLLFGRDYYEQDLHTFLQTLNLSQEVLNKIYFQNAEKLVSTPQADLPQYQKQKFKL